ncbi:hypothetical protein ELR99_15305 [Salmonella enterica subsp. enterica serovar Newport]|nr:hypothetical protein [Salmonella enterica subsp. enterica serovar Montevideo]ECA5181395.1 hypothetical protein [Salmonella enterica subsp. enterica serovar Newport]ECD4582065.1 hypothetical protein [Salmonella enterica subsp. enterica serovar Newport]
MKKYSLLEMLEYCLDDEHMDEVIDSSGEDGAYEFHEEVDSLKMALSFCTNEILDGMGASNNTSLAEKLHVLSEINKIQNYLCFIDNHLFGWVNGKTGAEQTRQNFKN